ncbi:hypothetical protein CYMTET_41386 [Cymbomonas tetramitiformis]|uniref:Serine hydrolase domain-containing protein n=1 Tax=Cymbomonas tetramitiformis TaxID=36881 RepID=A0AAE0C649_9CHLO|nr:hypothetical protein CYMTET_41386 [Cymbomonas tetramitiformis]
MYAYDSLAQTVAAKARHSPDEEDLAWPYRLFLYLSLVNSEDITLFSEGLRSLAQLRKGPRINVDVANHISDTVRKVGGRHEGLLLRFGRYPHRNQVLGRQCTTSELIFMQGEKPLWMRNELGSDAEAKSQLSQSRRKGKPLKILVLHGNRQSANFFAKKTKKILSGLFPNVSLRFVQAPHAAPPPAEAGVTAAKSESSRQWFNATDSDPDSIQYVGLEQSIQYIDSIVSAEGPFEGVVGFSQGSCMAGILAALQAKGSPLVKHLNLRFCICISGFYCRDARTPFRHLHLQEVPELHEPGLVEISAECILLPSFHCWGTRDTHVENWRSDALSQCFKEAVVATHDGAHFSPGHWPVKAMAEWLGGVPGLSGAPSEEEPASHQSAGDGDAPAESLPDKLQLTRQHNAPSFMCTDLRECAPLTPRGLHHGGALLQSRFWGEHVLRAASKAQVVLDPVAAGVTMAQATQFVEEMMTELVAEEAKHMAQDLLVLSWCVYPVSHMHSPGCRKRSNPQQLKMGELSRWLWAAVARTHTDLVAAMLADTLPSWGHWTDLKSLALLLASSLEDREASTTDARPPPPTTRPALAPAHRLPSLPRHHRPPPMTPRLSPPTTTEGMPSTNETTPSTTDTSSSSTDQHRCALIQYSPLAYDPASTSSSRTWQQRLHAAIVDVFACQLSQDIHTLHHSKEGLEGSHPPVLAVPTDCAMHAPRLHSPLEKHTHLARHVAARLQVLREGVLKYGANSAYTHALQELGKMREAADPQRLAREEAMRRADWALETFGARSDEEFQALLSKPLHTHVLHPEPEPVEVSTASQLAPVHEFLRSVPGSLGCSPLAAHGGVDGGNAEFAAPAKPNQVFTRGTMCTDGRLDMCKQVIGPAGVTDLIQSLEADGSGARRVKHILLGNNIAGHELGPGIAGVITRKASAVTTWYIAGNRLDGPAVAPLCNALRLDTWVKQLWLKRNPLKSAGALQVASMLAFNTHLQVLDLANCGLLDEGAQSVLRSLDSNPASGLRHLYLNGNGLMLASVGSVCELLTSGKCKLQSLGLGCNRIGDQGAALLADALSFPECDALIRLDISSAGIGPQGAASLGRMLMRNTRLLHLDVGYVRMTKPLFELPNRIRAEGAAALAAGLESNSSLLSLSVLHNSIELGGLEPFCRMLERNSTLVRLDLEQSGMVSTLEDKMLRSEIKAALSTNLGHLDQDAKAKVHDVLWPAHLEEVASVYRLE